MTATRDEVVIHVVAPRRIAAARVLASARCAQPLKVPEVPERRKYLKFQGGSSCRSRGAF